MASQKRHSRFHGRIDTEEQRCAWPGCTDAGEFRAPVQPGGQSGDQPGRWRYLCLDHVREFNAGYDYFAGMSDTEIYEAQHPVRGWDNRARIYNSGPSVPPAWSDFADPLDAIAARFRGGLRRPAEQASRLSAAERKALNELGLDESADRRAIRRAYSERVRRYHPDRNGGDRSHEDRLGRVVEAYQRLRKSPAFA